MDYYVYTWRSKDGKDVKHVFSAQDEKRGKQWIIEQVKAWFNQGIKPPNYKLCYNGVLRTPAIFTFIAK
jgi:hypothetical protein